MMANLTYERLTVPGAQALAEWERLRTAGRGVPVVIGNDEDLERLAKQFSVDDPEAFGVMLADIPPRSTAEVLTAAEGIRFPTDLQVWTGARQQEDLDAPEGEWPSSLDAGGEGLSVATDISTQRFHNEVHILLIPAQFSWELPAYLKFGDFNECHPAEYHVAALRSWHDRFGAELVGINADTLNVRSARCPEREEAIALAREQYAYCQDIVEQGFDSISALAATLAANRWWGFWWD